MKVLSNPPSVENWSIIRVCFNCDAKFELEASDFEFKNTEYGSFKDDYSTIYSATCTFCNQKIHVSGSIMPTLVRMSIDQRLSKKS